MQTARLAPLIKSGFFRLRTICSSLPRRSGAWKIETSNLVALVERNLCEGEKTNKIFLRFEATIKVSREWLRIPLDDVKNVAIEIVRILRYLRAIDEYKVVRMTRLGRVAARDATADLPVLG